MKRCSKCHIKKNISEFFTDKRNDDGLKNQCKFCHSQYTRKWEKTHPAERNARAKASRLRHLEKCRQRSREYIANMRKKDPEKFLERQRKWAKDNPERVKEQGRRSRENNPGTVLLGRYRRALREQAAMAEALCTLTKEQWRAILVLFDFSCAYCGRRGLRFEKDHKLPVSRGGATSLDNIVPACRSCNAKKGKKTVEEFMPWLSLPTPQLSN